jgi:hypothetical protein
MRDADWHVIRLAAAIEGNAEEGEIHYGVNLDM